MASRGKMKSLSDPPRRVIIDICDDLYRKNAVSGTGGGISIRQDGKIYLAPSGVQKERMDEDDIFEFTEEEATQIVSCSAGLTAPDGRKVSACTPLFMSCYQLRNAGAVIHTHSQWAVLATMLAAADASFKITEVEMIKGIAGHGYHDTLEVPIIDNTAFEHELTASLQDAIRKYPKTFAVLVRNHGVYVWGNNWIQAKTHCECYDYLFELAVRRRQLGV